MDDAFGNWLAGFIDGEGSFAIRPGGGRVGYHDYCFFAIEVRIDDAPIIEEIHRRTGIGKLWSRKKRGNPNWHDQMAWQVSRGGDCLALAELLDKYPLRAKKRKAFAIWRQALDDQLCYTSGGVGKRRPTEGQAAHAERMKHYKQELSEANQFNTQK